MANSNTHVRTHDPNGVYWTAGYRFDTAATGGTGTPIVTLTVFYKFLSGTAPTVV